MRTPWEPRFWAKVTKTDDCWIWTGHRATNGYGRFRKNQESPNEGAHRISYELLVGPVPAGLDLDHLCRRRECVRPEHLEPVTRSENLRRGLTGQREATVCRQGHLLVGTNVYHRADRARKNGRPRRECVLCRQLAGQRHAARSRDKGTARKKR